MLEAGDIFVSASIGDSTVMITRQHHMIDMMINARVGDTVEMTVIRDGEEITLSVEITADCITDY